MTTWIDYLMMYLLAGTVFSLLMLWFNTMVPTKSVFTVQEIVVMILGWPFLLVVFVVGMFT